MDSTEDKKDLTNPTSSTLPDPTVTMQSPPTVVAEAAGTKLSTNEIEDVLAKARKKLTDEDFTQALSIVDVLLKTDPNLDSARALRERILHLKSNASREIFHQGVNSFMESDWDRAIAYWKRVLKHEPDDAATLEWIIKAEQKREQERLIRAQLLQDLEQCGKMLSDRNYVVAEEHLDAMKNRFTGGFRLADLQRIYEALIVRTRVELEKEFEDLRSNVVEHSPPQTFERKPSAKTPKTDQNQLQKKYMDAFEAGKKFFEIGDWDKALQMWQDARRINPQDENLIHWIALAENNMAQGTPITKASPVRATFGFLGVFLITGLLTYLAYEKYSNYAKETKNRQVIQRAIEHYRAGRLEESWKTLQIYVLQDPEDDSARTLLERITAEMNARKTTEDQSRQLYVHLSHAREKTKTQEFGAAIQSYEMVLRINPLHSAARQEYDKLRKSFDSTQMQQQVSSVIEEARVLLNKNQLDSADEKIQQALTLRPGDPAAKDLQDRIESERIRLNRITAQIEIARFLLERDQKESAALVLNRILSSDPGQPQAKQLLARIRGTPTAPKFPIEIRIQPAAQLWIDGRDLGISSYFRPLESAGFHIIHIELHGFKSVDQSIEVKSSAINQFQFQLQRQ
jgi:tetratricopeptide (TPR) repeat protein